MGDDWRIRIEVAGGRATGLLERLGVELGAEARELAHDLEAKRLAVSRDGDEIFVYAPSPDEAAQAQAVIEAELRERGIEAEVGVIEHWLADEDRWDDEPASGTWESDELEHGHAPWEVRVQTSSRDEARRLAEELRSDGYSVARLFDLLVVGTATREDAEALATRLHGSVEVGGAVVWETVPGNPFAIFGGMGGSGTPG